MTLERITTELVRAVEGLAFGPPVAHVYNPLAYAIAPYRTYLRRFGSPPRACLFLGMNPGPFGMAQTGIPFGEVTAVREWMGIEAPVGRPPNPHPKRPVLGFACPRREVSGLRLWGWIRQSYARPAAFFARFFVANYCPLMFLTASGANITPDKLKAAEARPLFAACDRALRQTIVHFEAERVVGIGRFAAERAAAALAGLPVAIGVLTHPSPANPQANRGWERRAAAELAAMGISWGDA